MIARRLCIVASAFLMPLTLSVLRADVTLRYKTEFKINPAVPAQMSSDMMKGIASTAWERVLRFKDGKGFANSSVFDSITDFTTQEITIRDAASKRYAKLKASQFSDEMARAMPGAPGGGGAAAPSMKASVTPAKLTGRTAVIQGVEAEERELVFSMEGPAVPNMPSDPVIRMVMQVWTAKQTEIMRVPAIRELTGYSIWSYATMNPAAAMSKGLQQFPGLSDAIVSMNREMHQGTTLLRIHTEMFMPSMAAVLQRMPPGSSPLGENFDASSPFMQMNEEAAEISTEPVPESVFQIPAGYQEMAASDLLKGLFLQQRQKLGIQDQPEFVGSFVNRNLILRHLGDRSTTLKLKKTQLATVTGTCDIAVQVTKADWKAGAVHFWLQYIGTPSVPDRPRGNCSGPTPEELEISGFSPEEAPESVTASVAEVLLSSEQYLSALGIRFNISAEDDPSAPAVRFRQGGPDNSPPKVLLRVDGGYSAAARKSKIQGDLTLGFVVGADGRVHAPHIVQGIGYGIDENALGAISMWLFEPGRTAGKPVRITSVVQMNFRLL